MTFVILHAIEPRRRGQCCVDGVGRPNFVSTQVETLNEGDWRWVLQAIERYAHHPDYVRDVARAVGLEPREAIPFQPRMESGLPVRGTLHVLHKPR